MILFRQIAGFGQKAVVIITCYGWLIAVVMIGAIPESEIRSAVEHEKIDRCAACQHSTECLCRILTFTSMMLFSQMIEPTNPEFHAHGRHAGKVFLQRVEESGRLGS